MPPPNLTPATALVISSLPYAFTIDPEAAANDLWWVYTAVAGDESLGALGWAPDGSTYSPQLSVWLGPVGAPVQYLDGFYSPREQIQVPLAPGTTYYLKVEDLNGTVPDASLTLTVYPGPMLPTPAGSLMILDDADGSVGGYSAPIISEADGAVLRLPTMPSSEQGDINTAGRILTGDFFDDTTRKLFSTTFALLSTLTGFPSGTSTAPIRARGDHWYIGDEIHIPTIQTVQNDGSLGATSWVLDDIGSNLHALAVNVAESILYYAGNGSVAVKRWDLLNDVAMTDLVAAIATYTTAWGGDLLVMADGTILVPYQKVGPNDYQVLRYNPDGTLANTYGFGNVNGNRIQLALDGTSFWVWTRVTTGPDFGTLRYRRILASDGSVLADFSVDQFEAGVRNTHLTRSQSADRFGVPASCPLMVLQSSGTTVVTYRTRRIRRFPILSPDNLRLVIHKIEFELQRGVGTPTGDGSDPTIRVKFSKDGGQTWGPYHEVKAGKTGEYTRRAILWRLGAGRNWVCELSVDAPVFWAFTDCFINREESDS